MSKKKILYVITKSIWGGAQRYVFDLATNLPRDRFGVTVAAGGNGPLFEKLHHAGIRTIEIPSLGRDIHIYRELLAFWHLFQIFRKEEPDVIHLNSTKIGIHGALAACILKLLNPFTFKPTIVFTVHGWGFLEPRPWWQRAIIWFSSLLGALFQNHIILVSKRDLAAAQKFIPARKLHFIPLGIREPHFLPRKEARFLLSQKIGKPIAEDTLVVGTITELTKNKGITYLLNAVSNLSRLHLTNFLAIIIGGGEEYHELRKKINSLSLAQTTFLTGFIPDAAKYLKGFDIFVLPSLKEGLPYVLREARAAELPVVAANVGGIPDLIDDGKNGFLIPPKDAEALSKILLRLQKDQNLRRMLGKRGMEKAAQYTLPTMVNQTSALYK